MEKINLENLKKLIDDKYISVQKHPTAELYIYNYTQKCQFEKKWTPETIQCRGLIMDANHNIVSRPFPKFFNIQELDQVPAEEFEVFEKYDGSLGITYWIDGKPYLATRGSFTSEQALKGTEMLHAIFESSPHYFEEKNTYLFEIIYPSNRIVVDYGKTEELILLSVIETASGEEIGIPEYDLKKAERYYGIGLEELLTSFKENAEGFVIRFRSGLRCKIKYAEYVRLHRLLTGVNERRIWEILSKDGVNGLQEFIDRVPDEFYQWVRKIETKLLEKYLEYDKIAKQKFWYCSKIPTRKEQALWLSTEDPKVRSIVFAMLDNKPYSHIIWKYLKPAADKPFKIEI